MLRRCRSAHQYGDIHQEHHPPDIRHPALEKAAGDAETHFETDTVGGNQLHLPLLHRDEHLEPVVSAAVRLPPLSHRRQHSQGYGDSEGSQAAEV